MIRNVDECPSAKSSFGGDCRGEVRVRWGQTCGCNHYRGDAVFDGATQAEGRLLGNREGHGGLEWRGVEGARVVEDREGVTRASERGGEALVDKQSDKRGRRRGRSDGMEEKKGTRFGSKGRRFFVFANIRVCVPRGGK